MLILLVLLLLFQFFNQGQVFFSILLVGCPGQGFAVGRNCLIQLAGTGQGVTAVIPGIGIIGSGEVVDGLVVVSAAVGGGARPGRVLEQLRGTFAVVLLQCALALLVGCEPQFFPGVCAGRAGLGDQQQWQQAQYPAAAKQAQCQRQKWQQKQVALVLPGIRRALQLHGSLHCARYRLGQQARQVAVVQLQPCVPPPCGSGQFLQGGLIQGGHDNGAVTFLEKTAIGQWDGRACLRAYSQHRQFDAAVLKGLFDFAPIMRVYTIGKQQDATFPNTGGVQQIHRLRHRSAGIATRYRHHIGV